MKFCKVVVDSPHIASQPASASLSLTDGAHEPPLAWPQAATTERGTGLVRLIADDPSLQPSL